MCPAWLAPAAISAGGGLLSSLLDDDTMTPEQRRIYNMLMGEKDKYQGLSPQEKQLMGAKLKTDLTAGAQQRIAGSRASAVRRGVYSPGVASGMATDVNAGFGKAYQQGLTDIDLKSAEMNRSGKMDIYRLLMGMTGQGKPQSDMSGDIGDIAGNAWMYNLLTKKKRQGMDMGGGELGDYPAYGEVYG